VWPARDARTVSMSASIFGIIVIVPFSRKCAHFSNYANYMRAECNSNASAVSLPLLPEFNQ
jgi:hypothetical protein